MKRMRRLTAMLAAGAMVLGMSTALPEEMVRDVFRVEAADYTEGTYGMLTYENYGDYVRISSCNTLAMAVDIPSTIEGVPVTVIVDHAFNRCSTLTSVKIPATVTVIGEGAFQNCSSLTDIEIPGSVTTIKASAFKNCSSLQEFTIPDTVTTVGAEIFNGCSGLKTVRVPSHSTGIGNAMFAGCSSLINFTIPNNVTIIGAQAFAGCTSLKNIIIPDTVTTIGQYTFNGCSSLQEIEIPSTVTYIGYGAFMKCTSLTSIEIPNSVTTVGGYAFSGCVNLTDAIIHNTFLDGLALPTASAFDGSQGVFSGCTNLTNVIITDGVNLIPIDAFFNCKSLKHVTLPQSVGKISDKAFKWCDTLETITIMNPYCTISGESCIPEETIICGFENSTAQAFAIKYGRTFNAIYDYGALRPYTMDNTYSFPNTTAEVPLEYYEKYLDTAPSLTLWEWLRGVNLENGCCSGFTTTAISSNMYSTPLISAYTDSPANLFAVQADDVNSGNDLTALQNIMYGQVYQYTPYVMNQRNRNFNDYQALYDAVIDYCAGEEGVQIDVYGEEGGHSIWALGIVEETTIQTTIAVYDCNHPGTERDLILYKTNGQYSGWEYELTDDITWGSAAGGEITYDLPAYGFANDIVNISEGAGGGGAGGRSAAAAENTMALITAPNSVQVNANGALIPIQEANAIFDEDGNLVESVSETAFYWVDTGKSLNVSNMTEDSEIAIAFDSSRITATLPADATMSANTGDTSYANITAEDVVSVAYETISADGEVSAIIVDAEGDLNTRLSGDVLMVYGTDVTVSDSAQTYTVDDNTTYAITLSEDHTEILSVEEVTVVTGDLNADTNIDATDAAMILVAAAAVGAGGESGLTADQEAAADADGDGQFNAIDAAYILQYAAAAGAGYTGSFSDFLAENL